MVKKKSTTLPNRTWPSTELAKLWLFGHCSYGYDPKWSASRSQELRVAYQESGPYQWKYRWLQKQAEALTSSKLEEEAWALRQKMRQFRNPMGLRFLYRPLMEVKESGLHGGSCERSDVALLDLWYFCGYDMVKKRVFFNEFDTVLGKIIRHYWPKYCIVWRVLVFFKECFICLFSILENAATLPKHKDPDDCSEFCIVLLHTLPHVTYIIIIIIWYIYCIFHKGVASPKHIILYWTEMSAISSCKLCMFWKVFCIPVCCSWLLFKKKKASIFNMYFVKR